MIQEKVIIEDVFTKLDSLGRRKLSEKVLEIAEKIVQEASVKFTDEENNLLKKGLVICQSAKNFKDGLMLHMFSSELRGHAKYAKSCADTFKEGVFDTVAFLCRLCGYVNDDRLEPPYLGGVFRVLIESIISLDRPEYKKLIEQKILNRN